METTNKIKENYIDINNEENLYLDGYDINLESSKIYNNSELDINNIINNNIGDNIGDIYDKITNNEFLNISKNINNVVDNDINDYYCLNNNSNYGTTKFDTYN